MNIYDALILKAVGGGGGTTVVANPEGEATDDLEKLQVGNDIYGISKDYAELDNKPSINSVELSGNKTASELGLQAELDGAQTISGNPVTVSDAESMNAESVVVELEPKQDLHGYDAPWVGGAGKNKLPLTVDGIKAINTSGTWSGNTYSINGVTFEVLTDSGDNVEGIKVNGLASGNTTLVLYPNINVESGTYVISGCPNGGGNDTYRITIYYGSSFAFDTGSGVGVNISSGSSIGEVNIRIGSGTNVSDLTFKPMIRLATETDPTFAPYSNICPISGYSEVNVERVGKNWLALTVDGIKSANTDGTWNDNTYSINNGSLTIQSDSAGNVIGITANGTFNAQTLFYCKMNALSVERNVIYNGVSDGSANSYSINLLIGEWFAGDVYDGDSNIRTIPPNTETLYIIVLRNGYNAQGVNFYPMIRLSTETDPTFEPYQGSTATISLGGTKYGGTLDVTEGEYSDEWGYISGSSVSDLTSLGATTGTTDAGLLYIAVSGVGVAVDNDSVATSDQLVCNNLENVSAIANWTTNISGVCLNTDNNLTFAVKDITTQSDMDTWLSNNPIQIAYRKKTPSSASTTPTDIPLLENTNNISTDGTNITLKYQPNNVIGECKAYTDEKCAKVLPPLPTTDGTYHLSCEVTSGVGVLSWVSDS